MKLPLSSQNIFADLIAPVRPDLEAVALNTDGTVWTRYKGQPVFAQHRTLQVPDDVAIAFASVHELLQKTGQTLDAATPRCRQDIALVNEQGQIQDGQLTARHPSIAPGAGFPSVVLQMGDAIYRPQRHSLTAEDLALSDEEIGDLLKELQAYVRHMAEGLDQLAAMLKEHPAPGDVRTASLFQFQGASGQETGIEFRCQGRTVVLEHDLRELAFLLDRMYALDRIR